MKNSRLIFGLCLIVLIASCGNQDNKQHDHAKEKPAKTQLDSLKEAVDDGHNIGMGKMGKLTRAEQTTQRILDSISKLPAKAQKAAEPLRIKLDSLQKELSYAETAMEKWMSEYKWDSTFSSVKEEIDYLTGEKLKVTKVKEAILNGIQKADSLLKRSF